MPELVFDVGMHNGSDTAYYLARGYDVVAVEANPELCEAARTRFAAEIEAGRLEVKNVGVAAQSGTLEFWISEQSEWSSFVKEHAAMNGKQAHAIKIPTMPFEEILDGHRTPLYIKIDIEMSDSLCLTALKDREALPQYVSFEGHQGAAGDIELLGGLGYRAFKCIRQNDWAEITPENVRRQGQIRKAISRTKDVKKVHRALQLAHYRKPTIDGYRFETGSSGPIAAERPGNWMTADQAVQVWRKLLAIDREMDAQGFGEWFDVHASLS